MAEMMGLFPAEVIQRLIDRGGRNPMVARLGRGPDGTKCKDCKFLEHWSGGSKSYYKCRLRGVSSSEATDHRLNWQACKRFEREDG